MNEDEITKWWQRIDWSGAVAFVLALGVSISLVGGVVGGVFHNRPISEVGATIFGAVVGSLAGFLGRK